MKLFLNTLVLEKPKYYDTNEGKIIHAIVFEGIYGKKEIEIYVSIKKEEFEEIFSKLKRDEDIYLKQEGMYWVETELWKKWKNYTPKFNNLIIDEFKLGVGLENINNKHTFLDSLQLYKTILNLIHIAKKKIVIVNPYIELIDSMRLCGLRARDLDIKIITTNPTIPERIKTIQYLKNKGASIYYNKSLHGKVLVVDDEIAVVSSSNCLQNSALGINWEAGIITYDELVVKKIIESINNIASERVINESDDFDASMNENSSMQTHNTYGHTRAH